MLVNFRIFVIKFLDLSFSNCFYFISFIDKLLNKLSFVQLASDMLLSYRCCLIKESSRSRKVRCFVMLLFMELSTFLGTFLLPNTPTTFNIIISSRPHYFHFRLFQNYYKSLYQVKAHIIDFLLSQV